MVVGDSLSLVLQVMMRHSVPCMHTCVHAYYMHAHNALNTHNALILSPASCVTSCLTLCLMPYASCTHSHFVVGGRMRRASKPPGRVCTLPWAFACRHAGTLGRECEKFGTLHEFACHPCAGAMLIFSVSFQF